MKLIKELSEEVKLITEESASGAKNHYIHGIFMQANLKNKNKRMYPTEVLDEAVAAYMPKIKSGRAYGELGHPDGPQINLDRVCILTKELTKEGTDYYGKALITDTPSGKIVSGLLGSGCNLGVSSRALGTLKEQNSTLMVQPGLQIQAVADVVADPSAPGAFVQGIMENVDWIYEPATGTWREQRLEQIKKEIKRTSSKDLNEAFLKAFGSYVKSL